MTLKPGETISGALRRIVGEATQEAVRGELQAQRHQAQVPRLLTREEAADRLRVSVATIDRLRLDGRLPCTRIGRRVLFRPADLDALTEG